MKQLSKSILSRFFLFGVVVVFLSSCKKDGQDDQENVSKQLLLLKVDYLTHDFEGGQRLEMAAYTNLSDTLPLIKNYTAPSDFGNISFHYKSVSSTSLVFDGSIIWDDLGSRSFPTTLASVVDFPVLGTPLSNIDSTQFHVVHYDLAPQKIYYDSIWDGIKNLEIVDYFRSNALRKMSLFLYRPSDGPGDPADWDWYIVMEK